MTLNKIDDGIYLDDTNLTNVDSIIFDCDGVLIDISKSYNLVIQKTTEYFLKKLVNILEPISVNSKIIEGFKATGGFNDEVDLTYVAILSIAAADKLNKNAEEFIFQVIKNADQSGIKSVEKFLTGIEVDISEIKNKLDYPGSHHQNPLYSIFDQLFYGPELYSKLFSKESEFTEPGLIAKDQVILNPELLDKLKKKFVNKIAIVTGRGIDSISFSLKDLLNEFDTKNSVFLEDESRDLAKPNPESLIRSIRGLESSHCIFVGDSMEDLIMARKATEMGFKTTFCGIVGTSKNPQEKRNLFEKQNVTLILKSINQLPKALNLV